MVDSTSIAVLGCWRVAEGRVMVRTFPLIVEVSSMVDVATTADFSLRVDMIDKDSRNSLMKK